MGATVKPFEGQTVLSVYSTGAATNVTLSYSTLADTVTWGGRTLTVTNAGIPHLVARGRNGSSSYYGPILIGLSDSAVAWEGSYPGTAATFVAGKYTWYYRVTTGKVSESTSVYVNGLLVGSYLNDASASTMAAYADAFEYIFKYFGAI